MNSVRFILFQVLNLVHRQTLDRIVKRYEPTISVRHFGFRQQLTCMVFAQMTSRDGLRDIATCLNPRTETLYHLGFTEPVAKSTLADAIETRDWRIATRPGHLKGAPFSPNLNPDLVSLSVLELKKSLASFARPQGEALAHKVFE